MGRAAHDTIADAERVHDVERHERDVRRLEHIAAGVEHEVRWRVGPLPSLPRKRGRIRWGLALPQALQERVVELQPRDLIDVARDLAKAFDTAAALRDHVVLGSRHGDTRHAEQKARIDAVVAGLDAIAGTDAAARPLSRRLVASLAIMTLTQDIDDAADDAHGIVACRGFEPGSAGDRTDLDALAAARAGVGHCRGAGLQGGFEGFGHRCHPAIGAGTVPPTRSRLKAFPSRCKTGGPFHTRSSRRYVPEN